MTRAEIVAEAKALGIKYLPHKSVAELTAEIAHVKGGGAPYKGKPNKEAPAPAAPAPAPKAKTPEPAPKAKTPKAKTPEPAPAPPAEKNMLDRVYKGKLSTEEVEEMAKKLAVKGVNQADAQNKIVDYVEKKNLSKDSKEYKELLRIYKKLASIETTRERSGADAKRKNKYRKEVDAQYDKGVKEFLADKTRY